MATNTVNISFQSDLLKAIDRLAEDEARSRSELIREAARMYIEKKSKWNSIFTCGDAVQSEISLNEDDIVAEIKKIRKAE